MYLTMKEAMSLTGQCRKSILRHVKLGHFTTKEPTHQGREMRIDQDSIIAHFLPGLPKKKS